MGIKPQAAQKACSEQYLRGNEHCGKQRRGAVMQLSRNKQIKCGGQQQCRKHVVAYARKAGFAAVEAPIITFQQCVIHKISMAHRYVFHSQTVQDVV